MIVKMCTEHAAEEKFYPRNALVATIKNLIYQRMVAISKKCYNILMLIQEEPLQMMCKKQLECWELKQLELLFSTKYICASINTPFTSITDIYACLLIGCATREKLFLSTETVLTECQILQRSKEVLLKKLVRCCSRQQLTQNLTILEE